MLILEDDPSVRQLLADIFEGAGYACLTADEGRKGLAMFRAGRPHLTVVDVKMPVIDGVQPF